MRFHCEGRDYDTDQLTALPTGNRAMPFVYVSPDFAHVFVQIMERELGVTIRHATTEEIRRLANLCNLPGLLRALPPAPAPPPSAPPQDHRPDHPNP